MSTLLYIESSPRKERSVSITVSKAFLDAYKKKNPNDEIVVLDLWEKDLPAFDGDVIDAKYAIMQGKSPSPKQKEAWKAVEDVIAEFKGADKYVISLPMWNYSIPYKLKHYIDVIVQPGYTFSFSPTDGYKGLIKDKKMAVIYARGGAYGPGTGAQDYDMQTKYMEEVLKFIGFDKLESIIVEPTQMGGSEVKEKVMSQSEEKAKTIASQF